MSQPIDVAYVELKASGEKKAAKDIKNALDDVDRDVKKVSHDVEKSFAEAAHDIEIAFKEMSIVLTREASAQRRAWRKVARTIGEDMIVGAEVAKHAIDDLGDDASRDLKKIERHADKATRSIIKMGAARTLSAISGALTTALGALGSALAGVGSLVAKSPLVVLIAALVPVVIALSAALSHLIGLIALLPAGIGFLAAVISPLIIAFQGLGDAISALAEGDMEKIKEAMKKLSPAAQRFAREINDLRKPFGKLKKAVQEAFFKPLEGTLTRLAKKAFPTLKTGLVDVANSLGGFLAKIGTMLGKKSVLNSFKAIFASTGRIIDRIGPPLIRLFESLATAAAKGMPFVERMFGAIGRGLVKFANFIDKAVKNGDFERWIENAFSIMKDLGGLLKEVGGLIVAVFGGTSDEGKTFLQQITDIVRKLKEFFQTPQGKKALQDTLDSMIEVGNAIVWLVGALTDLSKAYQDLKDDVHELTGMWDSAVASVRGFFAAIWEGILGVGRGIGQFFTDVGNFLVGIGNKLREAWTAVVGFFNNVVTWFQQLPGRIIGFLQTLPGIVVGIFTSMINQVAYIVGFGIGLVVKFFMDLPGKLMTALTALWNVIVTAFNTVRSSAVSITSSLVSGVIAFFAGLPERARGVVSSIIERIHSVFNATRDRAVSATRSVVNTVVSWFQQLPGRAMSTLQSLPGRIANLLRGIVGTARSIGGDIMDGIAQGIRNGWNSAINAAKDAAREVLRGFWDALGIRSPSKVMAVKVGKPIMQGIGAGIETGVPDVQNIINGAAQSIVPDVTNVTNSGGNQAVTFGAGAIQITFSGATPTEDQARRTGAAVGQGIVGSLVSRNIRVGMRVL